MFENITHKVEEAVQGVTHKVEEAVHAITHPFDHNHDPGVIFITGGNGVLGSRVARQLLKAGFTQVRLGVRDAESSKDFQEQGAELVDFCWEKEETYDSALAGVKTVFCTTPHHEGWADRFPAFFGTCKTKGVKHFVKVSFYHALTATRAHTMKAFNVALRDDNPFTHVPLIQMHGDCDELIMKSHNIDYTILFSTHLMSNPLVYQGETLREQSKFFGASAGKGVNYISPNDIAEVAVRILLSPDDHKRIGYTLTGPAAIKDEEVASLLGKALGKNITYVDTSPEEFDLVEHKKGDPEWLIKDLVNLERVKASGLEESVNFLSKDIEKVCGRPPETFEEYLIAASSMSPKEKI